MSYESVILILFVIASLVSVVARRLNLPYTIALVGVGLVLGSLQLLHPPVLTQELLYAIFLPPLVFEAAIHLKFDDLRKNFWVIATLVVPGVVVSTLATAAVMIPVSISFTEIKTISWPLGILFGAAVAATDPVSVVAIFKRLGAPRRLRVLIESESLLNDGTSIVVFILALQFIQGHLDSPQSAAVDFFRIVGLGLLVGAVVGLLTATVMRHLDDAMITITLTTLAAYGAFLIADRLGVSGVMSTVAAGLICGERGFAGNLFPSIRLSTEAFWEYIVFALNSLIFLLMGFAINLEVLWQLWPVVLIAYVSVLAARFVVVTGTWALFLPGKLRFPFRWSVILSWGGLRGALSMVLALSIQEQYEFREMVVTLVFGVVLLSIFVQGLSMAPLMKWLKIVSPVSELKDYEMLKAEVALLQQSLDRIEQLTRLRLISSTSAEQLRNDFQARLDELQKQLEAVQPEQETMVAEEILRTRRLILTEQQRRLLDMYQNGAIGFDAYELLRRELDSQIVELENQGA